MSKSLPWCCNEEQGGMPGGRAVIRTEEQLCLETKRQARMQSRHIWIGEIPAHRLVARVEPVRKCELANGSPCMSQKSMFDRLGSVPNSSSVASHRGQLQRNEILVKQSVSVARGLGSQVRLRACLPGSQYFMLSSSPGTQHHY